MNIELNAMQDGNIQANIAPISISEQNHTTFITDTFPPCWDFVMVGIYWQAMMMMNIMLLMMMLMTRKIMMSVMMMMLQGCLQGGGANKMKVTAALFARSPITRIKRQDHTYKVQTMLVLVGIIVMLLLI